MPKFIPYQSPPAYLARKFRFIKQLRSLYFKYNKLDSELMIAASDPRPKRSPFFLGGLNPILAMKKDFVDTFKPYKANYYILRDLTQPVRGVGNFVRGLFNIVAAPLIFLGNTVRYALKTIPRGDFREFGRLMLTNLVKTGGGFLDGVTSVIRGVTQVIATPATWFIKMPLRLLITAIKGKPTVCQNVEKRVEKLETLIQKDDKTLEDTIAIDREMLSIEGKAFKAWKRGQEIGVDTDAIADTFQGCPTFTEKRLNTQACARLTRSLLKDERFDGGFGQTTHRDYLYEPQDSADKRQSALACLSLFKKKRIDVSEKLQRESKETDSLLERAQV